MTTINGHAAKTTVSDDVRVRVRAPESAPQAPSAPDSDPGSAHARAIPRIRASDHHADAHRVRNFASQHLASTRAALGGSWVATEVPMTIGAAARQVIPAKGRTSGRVMWTVATAAGVIRFVAITFFWVGALLFAGRIRAVVSTVIIGGLIVAHSIAN